MSSSKMQKISECEVDRLSTLPESILLHILSFLPIKDLMVTALLSRYAHLWRNIQILSFDECEHHDNCVERDLYEPEYDEKFVNLIHNVLINNESSEIHEFHLRFNFCYYFSLYWGERSDERSDEISKEKRMAGEISSWVRFAIRKNVKVLCLDFKTCGAVGPSYVLPNFALSSDSLTVLKLYACDINPRGKIHLKSLRILSVGLTKLSDKTMEEILVGCPLLEELSLIDFCGVSTLNLTNPKLEKLKLILGHQEPTKYMILCPHIISLEVAGWIEQADIQNARSLLDTSVHFSYGFEHGQRLYDPVKTLLKSLSISKVLKLCRRCIMVCTIVKFMNFQWPPFSWKCLVVETTPLTKWQLPGVLHLLKNSRNLESLTIYISSENCLQAPAKWMESYDFDGENYLDSQKDDLFCLRSNLKTITLVGSVTVPYAVKLIEFLLKRAMVLEKIVIVAKKDPCVEEQDHPTPIDFLHFSQKLLSMPRASSGSTIQFSCPGL